MSIEVILKAAEYIERRERGKRGGFSLFSCAYRCDNVARRMRSVLYRIFVGFDINASFVFSEAEHGYAMMRPSVIENVPSSRRRISTTSAKRAQQSTSVGVR